MIDTNIVSNIVRHPNGQASQRLKLHPGGSLCTSVVVLSELYFGAERVKSASLKRRIDDVLALIDVLALGASVADHYAQIRTDLEKQGLPIGGNDLFIAAHARALDLTLVTDNIREFSRVPNLRVENWLG